MLEVDTRPAQELLRVTDFLTSIGMPWSWAPGSRGFVEHIDIRDGELLVDPRARASGLLHEAGHIAIIPAEFRVFAQSNISGVQRLLLEAMAGVDPDGPAMRAALQCSDPEATAWAWAAGEHIGLLPQVIIQDDEYDHSGQEMRTALLSRRYLGINGLSHAGFCATSPGAYAAARGLPAYPQLKFWLQQDFSEHHAGETPRERG